MYRPLAIFVVSALVSGALQLAVSSCESDDDCDCPPAPEYPALRPREPVAPFKDVVDAGLINNFPFEFSEGTIELTGKQLVLRYKADGTARQATYNVVPNN